MEEQLFKQRAVVLLTDILLFPVEQDIPNQSSYQNAGTDPIQQFYCPLCGTCAQSKDEISSHMVNHHGTVCHICGRTYPKEKGYRLYKHLTKHPALQKCSETSSDAMLNTKRTEEQSIEGGTSTFSLALPLGWNENDTGYNPDVQFEETELVGQVDDQLINHSERSVFNVSPEVVEEVENVLSIPDLPIFKSPAKDSKQKEVNKPPSAAHVEQDIHTNSKCNTPSDTVDSKPSQSKPAKSSCSNSKVCEPKGGDQPLNTANIIGKIVGKLKCVAPRDTIDGKLSQSKPAVSPRSKFKNSKHKVGDIPSTTSIADEEILTITKSKPTTIDWKSSQSKPIKSLQSQREVLSCSSCDSLFLDVDNLELHIQQQHPQIVTGAKNTSVSIHISQNITQTALSKRHLHKGHSPHVSQNASQAIPSKVDPRKRYSSRSVGVAEPIIAKSTQYQEVKLPTTAFQLPATFSTPPQPSVNISHFDSSYGESYNKGNTYAKHLPNPTNDRNQTQMMSYDAHLAVSQNWNNTSKAHYHHNRSQGNESFSAHQISSAVAGDEKILYRSLNGSGTVACRICRCIIPENKFSLRMHFYANHKEIITRKIVERRHKAQQQIQANRSAHQLNLNLNCAKCSFQTNDPSQLSAHIATVHPVSLKACDQCDYTSLFDEELDKHKSMYHTAMLQNSMQGC